ncbi:uncharacterized protein LOC117793693 [Drosophila innubila]|uniref:uncharacterized protein LOC117793693 n=1 Tax=Drosophila innubila TaxID=198719 RepID=UPI00148E04FD|nr:uncharacterized protein LOC117793693 [Drosophila innubila]
MQKLTDALGLSLTVLICCGGLLQAAPYPPEMPSNPVYYKRFHRNRPSSHRDMDVYEVRELYYLQRSTPKPKIRQLTDVEIDQLILCDFEPTLPMCTKLINMSSTSKTSTSSSTTTTTTEVTSTIPTTIAITSTDLPLLPMLPTVSNDFLEVIETTTTSPEDEDYQMEPDNGSDDFETNDDENTGDDIDEPVEAEDYLTSGGSIGGNDLTK